MHSNPGAVAGAALLPMLLAACQPVPTGRLGDGESRGDGACAGVHGAPGATPTPAPREQQAAQQAEQQKQDALYREAERVYRAFLAEDEKISRAGSLITPDGGPCRGEARRGLSGHLCADPRRGREGCGGQYQVLFVRGPWGFARGLGGRPESCVDARDTNTMIGGRTVAPGKKVRAFQFFEGGPGNLKLSWQKGETGDTVC